MAGSYVAAGKSEPRRRRQSRPSAAPSLPQTGAEPLPMLARRSTRAEAAAAYITAPSRRARWPAVAVNDCGPLLRPTSPDTFRSCSAAKERHHGFAVRVPHQRVREIVLSRSVPRYALKVFVKMKMPKGKRACLLLCIFMEVWNSRQYQLISYTEISTIDPGKQPFHFHRWPGFSDESTKDPG